MTDDSLDFMASLGCNDHDLASILNLGSTTGNLLIYTIQVVIFKQTFNITLFV